MFKLVVFVSVLVGVLSGGSFAKFGQLRLKRFYWIMSAFLMKFVSSVLLQGRVLPSPALCIVLSSVTYAMLFYGLYPNLQTPGFLAISTGMFLNFIVIVINGGRMPVGPGGVSTNLTVSQIQALSLSLTHKQITNDVKLKFLADIFKWDFLCMTPTAFSLGDVLMAIGASHLVISVSHGGFSQTSKDVKISQHIR